MKSERKVIAASVCLAALYWLFDALKDWLLHYDGTFWQLLITNVPSSELFSRIAVFGLLVLFGALVARTMSKRRQAENAVSEQQQYFRSLIENASDAISILNDDGTVRYESPSVERVLGYKPEELTGKSVLDYIHPDDAERVAEAFAGTIDDPGQLVTLEVRFMHKDGSWRSVEGSGRNLLRDKKVNGIVVNYRDVSERKQAELASQESEERLKRLVEEMNDGYCVFQGSRLMFANTRITEMFGHSQDEVIGKTVDELLPQDVVNDLSGIHHRRLRGESAPVQYEATLVGRSGAPLSVELSTRITTFGGKPALSVVVRDITERRQMEQELQRNEDKFRSIIEHSFDGISIISGDGVVLYESPAVNRMLGYQEGDRLGGGAFERIHPDDLPIAADAFQRIMSKPKEEAAMTLRVRHGDGSWRWIECVGRNLVDNPNVAGIVVNYRDTTERKHAEHELRDSERRYRMLTENVTDVIWTMDMNLNFTYVSPSTERLIGYTPEEEMAIGLAGIMTPESLEVAFDTYTRGLAAEKKPSARKRFGSMTVELDHIHKDGHIVPTDVRMTFLRDADGSLLGILGVTRDMSKRQEMERELQQSEQSYKLLIESLNDSLIVVDAETLAVAFSNRRAARLYEFDSVDDFIGTPALGLVHPDDRDKIARAFAQDVHQQERRQRYEIRTVTRHGGEIWISALATRIEFHDRVAVLLSVKDITELKKAEEENARMEQQVRLSGRLASVGQLAAGVAHELNNPLAAIQAYAQFLTSNNDLDQTIRPDVETIYKEAQRASRITANLLQFSRKHEPEKKLISINEAIENSLDLNAYRMRVNNIEVSTDLDPELPQTMADFHQLQQVFVNLATNAEQAMTEASGRGTLTVKTQQVNGTIVVTIADDGPGIPEENLEKIFDPFFTTKEVGEGTGLGLSICFGIIEQHGGTMRARSEVGKGTTFTVELPVTSEDPTPAEQTVSNHVGSPDPA